MDNSRRNILIVIVSIFGICLCFTVVGLGVFGYLIPIDRITDLISTGEPVVLEPVVSTPVPTQIADQPTPTSSNNQPLPTAEMADVSPTSIPTEAPTQVPIPPEIAAQMDEIESQVIVLRKLQPAGTVSRRLLSRDELRQKIETDFFEDYSTEEAQDDNLVLSALGLLEPGFDMFTFYQDLLSEQIAGQYDQNSKEMDVVQSTGFGGTERLTYAHEYTHALQDQNYDIENGLNYSSEACEENSERCHCSISP